MKQCERCGESFTCGSAGRSDEAGDRKPCWCLSIAPVSNIPLEFKDCLCPKCLDAVSQKKTEQNSNVLEEGEDYYLENGLFVFTEKYHLKKGYCCNSNCRHCPY